VYLLIVPLHDNEPADTRRRPREKTKSRKTTSMAVAVAGLFMSLAPSVSKSQAARLSHPALPAGVGKRKSRDVLRA